ncbi:MAG: S9 family peptidase [Bacteroidota bacterium]
MKKLSLLLCLCAAYGLLMAQPANNVFQSLDIFEIEFASDPQISPDGKQIVYVRNFKDIMTDRNLSNLWIINTDGSGHRPLTQGPNRDRAPRWSPDGSQLLYSSNQSGKNQFHLMWMESGQSMVLTHLQQGAGGASWSHDGKWIAFSMAVMGKASSLTSMPPKPAGAKWNKPPIYIDEMRYRADGAGYLPAAHSHIFLLPATGGTPRQLTFGDKDYGGQIQWSKDNQSLIFSANLHDEAETEPRNSEVYELSIQDGSLKTLTSRKGPDNNPRLSPDGSMIAYTGFDDRYQGFQVSGLYVMNRDGSEPRLVSEKLDRSVNQYAWAADGKSLFVSYHNHGNTKLAQMTLKGKVKDLTKDIGGTSLGRPYSSGSFSVASNGTYAFTHSRPDHPADIAVGMAGEESRVLTGLNQDLFGHKNLGKVEEIWYKSSYDNLDVQGWICYPPDFDPAKKYPLMLEIHGGPFTNYGDRFSAEVQLFAAAGYVVLYTNPRGSTSYGEKFGNLIHHNYPSQDYDDLISGVDAVIAKGFIDEERLFVTGGSGGGVLTSWIVGKTDRFRAAVVAKPVINWYSFVLYADNPAFFYRYWFPDKPWNAEAHYMKRSPISLVGNVKTPTMLLTGESDYRTPISESEQYYAALKINGVESAMVRIPGAGHGIANRPSNLIAKVTYILAWFEKFDEERKGE